MRFGKVVIPARMESERLPKKMMIEIMGRPMIEHVWRRACLVIPVEDVVVATNSEVIASHMKSVGAQIFLSKLEHSNGTSRVSEYVNKFSLDFAVILQGDEILIRPEILRAIFHKMLYGEADLINVVSALRDIEDLYNSDVVKCWVDSTDKIRFIFRGNPLRNPSDGYHCLKIINGLFAISTKVFDLLPASYSMLASSESIEQLGVLNLGIELTALEVNPYLPSVNTSEDLKKAIDFLRNDKGQQDLIRVIT